jgi:5-methylcytosine-specific restriction endonuclease McrA
MREKVLVLNQDYQALSVCSVERAFVLVFMNKAELVHHNPAKNLHSVYSIYKFPSIIRLYSYVRIPYKKVALNRNNVFRRDDFSCLYCGTKSNLTIDHLIPRSRGGGDTWENLATACQQCNARKGQLTPEEVGLTLRRRPFKPSFIMYLREFSGRVKEEWRPYLLMN